MTTPPPNWYADPQDPTALRWWDGTQWTAHVRPGVQQATGYAGTPVATKGHKPIDNTQVTQQGAASAAPWAAGAATPATPATPTTASFGASPTPASFGASPTPSGVFAPGGNSSLPGGTGGRHVWQWILGLVALLAILGGAAWAVIAMTRGDDSGKPSAAVPSDRPTIEASTPAPSTSAPSGEPTAAPSDAPTAEPTEAVEWTARGDNATYLIPGNWRDLTSDAVAYYVEEEDFQSAEDLGGAWALDGRSWALSVNYVFAWVYEGYSPETPMEDLASELMDYYNADLTSVEVTNEEYFTTSQGYAAWRADVTGKWDGSPVYRRLIIVRDGVSTEMYFTLDTSKNFDEGASALLSVADSVTVTPSS